MSFSSFEVRIKVSKNNLSSEIIMEEKINTELTYAFYLLLDGVKVETKSYTKESTAYFDLYNDGKYQVVGFVRQGEERCSRKSQVVEFVLDSKFPIESRIKAPVGISVFGSCVSRDVLEYDLENLFSLKTYIARQSVVSAVSKPITIRIEEIKLESRFQQRCVYQDFDKSGFQIFRNDKSEYLIIDLIDERFDLVEICKSIVTYSTYLQVSDYIKCPNIIKKKQGKLKRKRYYVKNIDLDKYIEIFCKQILDIYQMEKVIIHRCKMCNCYIDKNRKINNFPENYLKYNESINQLLEYMYDCLQKYLYKSPVIDISRNYYADESHRWGLSPMHYQREYYETVFEKVEELIVKNEE